MEKIQPAVDRIKEELLQYRKQLLAGGKKAKQFAKDIAEFQRKSIR